MVERGRVTDGILGPSEALESGRLVWIRHLRESDRGTYVALYEASLEEMTPWSPGPSDGVGAGAEAWSRDAARIATATDERLAVIRHEDGALVGRVSVSQIVRGVMQGCVLGYWVGSRYACRGYTTEAVGLTLRHVFGRLGLHRAEANIQPANEASRRVVMRNGFRCEGVAERFLLIAGAWRDHERWAITSEEFSGDAG